MIKRKNKKQKLENLTRLCIKYFGKDFKHWSWKINSGNVEGYPRKVAIAIELPKYDINNNLVYTDPFIGKGGGETIATEIACDNAIYWINQKFNKNY